VTQTAPLLAARDLVKSFGRRLAVDRVSIDLHRGETFALVGPNGAGKTTALRAIAGLQPVDAGEVSLNVHRHVCSKNIRLVGLTNHPSTGYGPALRLLERYADRYPFAEMVTHEFGLHQADEALQTSMDPRSMKVAIVPGLTT